MRTARCIHGTPEHCSQFAYIHGTASQLHITYLWFMMSLYGLPFVKAMAKFTFMEVAGRSTTLQGMSCLTLSIRDICATKANFMEHTRCKPPRVVAGKFSGSVVISFV
jgi:hypothetical protein